jgi:hypothetical protein
VIAMGKRKENQLAAERQSKQDLQANAQLAIPTEALNNSKKKKMK